MNRMAVKSMFENVACLARGGYTPKEDEYIEKMVNGIMDMNQKEIERIKEEMRNGQSQ